jgi:PAS domain S-box-containing protein
MPAKLKNIICEKHLDNKYNAVLSDLSSGPSSMACQELEAVIRDSIDAIIVCAIDAKILSWNKGAKKLYGYSKKEARAMYFNDLVDPSSVEENLEIFKNIVGGIPIKLFKTDHLTKDKRILNVWVSVSRLINSEGRTGAFVITVHDNTEAKRLMESNRYLAQAIIQAHEEERKRIAQGIHDDLGQSLVALKMFFVAHTIDVMKGTPVLKEKVSEIQTSIDEIIEKARHLSHELFSPGIQYAGLVPAIKKLIKMYADNKKISIRFVHRNMSKVSAQKDDVVLYRIVQESLSNSLKHAKATSIKISLSYAKGLLTLKIHDNGKGFQSPPEQLRMKGAGVGIAIMRERAQLINADFKIESSPKNGTTVIVTHPIAGKDLQ